MGEEASLSEKYRKIDVCHKFVIFSSYSCVKCHILFLGEAYDRIYKTCLVGGSLDDILSATRKYSYLFSDTWFGAWLCDDIYCNKRKNHVRAQTCVQDP